MCLNLFCNDFIANQEMKIFKFFKTKIIYRDANIKIVPFFKRTFFRVMLKERNETVKNF